MLVYLAMTLPAVDGWGIPSDNKTSSLSLNESAITGGADGARDRRQLQFGIPGGCYWWTRPGNCDESCDGSCDDMCNWDCDGSCDRSCDESCDGRWGLICDEGCDNLCNDDCDDWCNKGCDSCDSGCDTTGCDTFN